MTRRSRRATKNFDSSKLLEMKEKPFKCEAMFRTQYSEDTSKEEFLTREAAERWCRDQRVYLGFYKAWINNVEFKV